MTRARGMTGARRLRQLKLLTSLNLTLRQHEIVRAMARSHRWDDAAALVMCGPSRKRTLSALEHKGLVRYYPHGGERREGVWGLTSLGRQVAAIDSEILNAKLWDRTIERAEKEAT